MAVDLVRISDSFSMTGGATWDTIATVPTSSAPNSSSMLLDVIIHGSSGFYAGEASVVARYQSAYRKGSGGTITILGSIQTINMKERFSGSAAVFEYRQTISGSNILVEVRGLVADTTLTFDVNLRSL
jgi:hypothetical protein